MLPITLSGSIPAQTDCSGCSLLMKRVAQFNSAKGVFVPSRDISIVKFSTGAYLVSYRFVEPTLVMFDSKGTLLRIHDKRGAGPGEFQSFPHLVMGRGDTVYAFDRARLLRFDRSLRHVDTKGIPLTFNNTATVLGDGQVVLDAWGSQEDGRTTTLAILSADGRSVSTIEVIVEQKSPGYVLQLIAQGQRGIWSIRSNDSTLRFYSHSGEQMLATTTIKRSWFTPWDARAEGEGWTVRPRPSNAWLRPAPKVGCLLLGTRVADDSWRSPLNAQGKLRPSETDLSALYDTTIELLDPANGYVLVSARFPQELVPVEGAIAEFASTGVDSAGNVLIDIWRMELSAQLAGRASCQAQRTSL